MSAGWRREPTEVHPPAVVQVSVVGRERWIDVVGGPGYRRGLCRPDRYSHHLLKRARHDAIHATTSQSLPRGHWSDPPCGVGLTARQRSPLIPSQSPGAIRRERQHPLRGRHHRRRQSPPVVLPPRTRSWMRQVRPRTSAPTHSASADTTGASTLADRGLGSSRGTVIRTPRGASPTTASLVASRRTWA